MHLLRKLAFPISLVYALVVYLRNRFYDYGWFSSQTFDVPVVCVGNLSLGGTGKTPMIEWMVARLSASKKVVVLSRGYGRKSKGFRKVTPECNPLDSGDEPLQIALKFPQVTVAVDANRSRGIRRIEKDIAPDIILLDDAFQHRKVQPDISLLLTAYGRLYPDDWYLPTGDLRDHKGEARRASAIIVTKCPPNLGDAEKSHIIARLRPRRGQMVLFSYLDYAPELRNNNGSLQLETLEDKPFTLVTGIANPEPLVAYLRDKKLHFKHRRYRDHHQFSEKEIAELDKLPLVITTEKDYMRLKGSLHNLYYLPVSHKFMDRDDKRLLALLGKL